VVPQLVRLTPSDLVDEFLAALKAAGTPARKGGRVVVVGDDGDAEPERRLELLFFVRAWALSHPGVVYKFLDTR
jgi:hypothetical protein